MTNSFNCNETIHVKSNIHSALSNYTYESAITLTADIAQNCEIKHYHVETTNNTSFTESTQISKTTYSNT